LTRERPVAWGAYANKGRKLGSAATVVGSGVEVEVISTTAVVVTTLVDVLANGVRVTTLWVVDVYSK
jgi:hypothetical protein